jgi:hypothetical protein
MAVDFAIIGSLVRSGRPRIRFLSIGPRLCSTLPSDPASRRRPCASLILRHHQAGWRTFTSKLSIMLGTPNKSPVFRTGPQDWDQDRHLLRGTMPSGSVQACFERASGHVVTAPAKPIAPAARKSPPERGQVTGPRSGNGAWFTKGNAPRRAHRVRRLTASRRRVRFRFFDWGLPKRKGSALGGAV